MTWLTFPAERTLVPPSGKHKATAEVRGARREPTAFIFPRSGPPAGTPPGGRTSPRRSRGFTPESAFSALEPDHQRSPDSPGAAGSGARSAAGCRGRRPDLRLTPWGRKTAHILGRAVAESVSVKGAQFDGGWAERAGGRALLGPRRRPHMRWSGRPRHHVRNQLSNKPHRRHFPSAGERSVKRFTRRCRHGFRVVAGEIDASVALH